MKIICAEKRDLKDILRIQKSAFTAEVEFYGMPLIRPMRMDIADIEKDFLEYTYLKAVEENMIAGSVKFRIENSAGYIGNLVVDPEMQNRGIGGALMTAALKNLEGADRVELFTAYRSIKNIKLYEKLGFVITREEYISDTDPKMVFMERRKTL